MFPNLHFILILSALKIEFGLSNEYGEMNTESDVYVRKDEFDRFKRAVIEELEQLKEGNEKLNDDIRCLKTENAEKDRKINKLERQLANHEKNQVNGMARRRIPYYETIAFTAYLDHGVHNLTQDRPVIYNKVIVAFCWSFGTIDFISLVLKIN
jgi:hypothetical protein